LAAVGAGTFDSVDTACKQLIKVTESIEPIPENVQKYKKLYPVYQELYKDLCERFKQIDKVREELCG
jgi:xylulokinase